MLLPWKDFHNTSDCMIFIVITSSCANESCRSRFLCGIVGLNWINGFMGWVLDFLPQCYGSGAPGRKFFEDIAATPDSPSPSKCPGAEPGTQSSSSAGSANQKTMWFRSVRIPVMLLKAKASSMMASTRTCPLPAALVVKSPIYCTAPKGGTGISVRKTAKVVLGRRPSACKSSVSTPRTSSLGKTVTVAAAFGRQAAMGPEAGTRLNLDGLRPCA